MAEKVCCGLCPRHNSGCDYPASHGKPFLLVKNMANKQHKMYGTPTYKSWSEMKYRCGNPKRKLYKNISFVKEWDDFRIFFKDMGIRLQGTTLDRINGRLGYSKENCRWATYKEQAVNRKSTMLVGGKTLTEWSKILGIKRSTLAQRYYVYGWSVNKTLSIKKHDIGQ